MASRLFVEVREKRGLVYGVSAGLAATRHIGAMRVYAGTTPEQGHECLEVIVNELRKLQQEGITADELERAKVQLKSENVMRSEGSGARMSCNSPLLVVRTQDPTNSGNQGSYRRRHTGTGLECPPSLLASQPADYCSYWAIGKRRIGWQHTGCTVLKRFRTTECTQSSSEEAPHNYTLRCLFFIRLH